jgi:serine/threonine protein kinase
VQVPVAPQMDQNSFSSSQASELKYQLLLELGRGGMGVANLAVSRGPQGFAKLVVLKMMRKQLVGDAESYRMFLQEARISARLTHPNIVHVYEVTEYDHAPTLVMEYLEGQTLWQVLKSAGHALPLPLHLHVLTKVLSGLHAAHELRDYDGTPLNLVHRDVSPQNVCVLFDGQVKVLDFGIAKAATSEVETRVGEFKGKVRYMPPEQLVRGQQDRRVDIFAVGVMLWEAIMGRRYWGDTAEGDVYASLLAKKIPALPPPGAAAPHQLRFICAQALAADPNCRYGTAAEFQRDLEDYLLAQPDRALAEDELGIFMSRHFDGERETARRVIEAHLREVQMLSDPEPPDGGGAGGRASDDTEKGASLMPTEAAPAADHDTRVLETKSASRWKPAAAASPPPAAPAPALAAAPVMGVAPASMVSRGTAWGGRPFAVATVAGVAVLALVLLGLFGAAGLGRMVRAGQSTRAEAEPPRCGQGLKSCDGQCVSVDEPAHGCGGDTCDACSVSNATARCNRHGACDIAACHVGFDDCDGAVGNGCETNLRVDPDHCTSCERRCPPLPHAQRGCGDACTIWRCEAGFHDCNGSERDGCEANLASDPENCGSCGHACGAGRLCEGGACR